MTLGREAVVSTRALNRALLDRQLLLERSDATPTAVLEQLVGMQAQDPNAPYVGLWTRIDGFEPEALSTLIEERAAVRIALMRGTLHLVTASDCLWLRALTQPVLERAFWVGSPYGRRLDGLDVDEVLARGRVLVESEPRTTAELGQLLGKRWRDRDTEALAYAVRYLVPLVQVPPRGIWGTGGAARSTTVDQWIGQPIASDATAADLVLRYLAAFGPASVKDIQSWSGLTRLGDVVNGMRAGLRTLRDERGVELFDLPDASRPPEEVAVPVRFLPEYDNILLAHDDRSRIIAEDDRGTFLSRGGVGRATVLIGGFARASWKIVRNGKTAVLEVEPFGSLRRGDRSAIETEGQALLRFAAADVTDHDVVVGIPD